MLAATVRRSGRCILQQRPLLTINHQLYRPTVVIHHFSTEKESKTETESNKDTSSSSLRDTVHRLKEDDNNETSSTNDDISNDLLRKAADLWETAKSEISLTWQELVHAGAPKSINKKIHPVETQEGNQEYTGPVEIMVIDESEHLTAWERMQRRLQEAPIIQGMRV